MMKIYLLMQNGKFLSYLIYIKTYLCCSFSHYGVVFLKEADLNDL